MRQAEAIRISTLCESNLKVPLRRLSFCSLKSGGVTGGRAQTTAETLTGAVTGFFPLLVFLKDCNTEMNVDARPGPESSGFAYPPLLEEAAK